MTVDVKHKPLEISHHSKATDWTSVVVTTFYGSTFNFLTLSRTVCVCVCVFTAPALSGITSVFSKRSQRLYPNGNFTFQEKKNKQQQKKQQKGEISGGCGHEQ